jgi:hypothetical protein
MSAKKSKQLRRIERQLVELTPQAMSEWYEAGYRDGWNALVAILQDKYNIQVKLTPEAIHDGTK